MPKLKETPVQRMERVFRAAVFYGLERRAETIDDYISPSQDTKDLYL